MSEPDYRFTLANERTFLAWIRTALALLAGGVAVSQFYTPRGDSVLHEVLGAVCIALACLVTLGAFVRWRRVQAAMRRSEDLPDALLTPVLVVGIVGASALGLVWTAW